MRTLEDAWNWYDNNKRSLKLVSRLGGRYWNQLPWDGPMGNDDHFRNHEGFDVKQLAESVLGDFDDLAVFVIFSVFEAIVRDHVGNEVKGEVPRIQHPALQRSAFRLLQNIAEGSFHNNVLELFKVEGNLDGAMETNSLIEEVSRVRRYRNWVAHGRRPERKPESIAPKDAYDTLSQFLGQFLGTNGRL